MAFKLIDDGTLDTVMRCAECGQVERYSFATTDFSDYDEFLDWALADVEIQHEAEGHFQEEEG